MKIILDGLNIEEELEEYTFDLEESGKSASTIKNYKIWINCFISYIKNSPEEAGAKIRESTIEVSRVKLSATRYQKHLQKLKQKNTTINLKTIALNNFFSYLHITEEDKRGRAVPVKISTLEMHHKHSIEDNRLMELTDFYKLVEVARESGDLRAVALFTFLFNTGARISEALSVDIGMVERAGENYLASIVGKRGKVRVIDFNQETFDILEEYLVSTGRSFKTGTIKGISSESKNISLESKGSGKKSDNEADLKKKTSKNLKSESSSSYSKSIQSNPSKSLSNFNPLFITEREYQDGFHRLSPKMADWAVKKYADMTGLPRTKFFSHNFRHLIAKTLLDEGATLDKVKNFLGHTNISTTAIYTMGKASELREVKTSAIKSARVRLIADRYEPIYKGIVEALAENSTLSDAKLAEIIGVSKATFSRNFREVVERIRGEF